MYRDHRVAVIVPAYNEAPAIGAVVNDILSLSGKSNSQPVVDALIVADNGSHDDTAGIAALGGATVVREPQKGYGAACLAGIAALPDVDVVVFVDGDRSVDVSELPTLLDALIDGADVVIGSRALGRQQPGSMTIVQHYGNRLAAWLLTRFWGTPVTDLGPFRALSLDALHKLNMQDRAFGWTVEMQIKALRGGMRVVEVPVTNNRRIGQSKVSGTLRGTIGASSTILGMIARCGFADMARRIGARLPGRRHQDAQSRVVDAACPELSASWKPASKD
ncbi:MAG: glycosyltransferase family 2 protein [Pseudomonadota bacterium]